MMLNNFVDNKRVNFAWLLQQRAKSKPNRTAFIYLEDGENQKLSVTYSELDEQARKIAGFLQSKGCAGERVLLLYPSGIDYIAAFFGCLYAGAIAVPLYQLRNNRRALLRMHSVWQDAQAKFILSTKANLQVFNDNQDILPQFNGSILVATNEIDISYVHDWQEPDYQEIAYLQYTSGSTGTPKGVMVAHHNLVHNSEITHHAWANDESSTIVSWLPLHHDMGLIAKILQAVYVGSLCVLMSPVHFIQKPWRWLKAISEYKAKLSGAPNFAYDLCVEKIKPEQLIDLDLSHWQIVYTGAEPVRSMTIDKFSRKFAVCGFNKESFYPCYGLAEITLNATSNDVKGSPKCITLATNKLEQGIVERVVTAVDGENTRTFVACGKALRDQKIKIVNPSTLNEVNENEIGEIWLSGPSKTLGYWNKPEETALTFHAEIANKPGVKYLRSGDLGFLQAERLYIVGRHKDLIIIRGKNYYPIDIEFSSESAALELEQNDSAAFSIEVEGVEQLVVVQTVKRTEIRKVDSIKIKEFIRKTIIDDHEINPYEIVLVIPGQIPKTSSGKVQRKLCKQLYLEQALKVI